MDSLFDAIGAGAVEIIKVYGLPGFIIIVLIGVAIVLWREVKAERKRNDDLNQQVNTEIKGGIAMAQDFRKTFETGLDFFKSATERRGR